MRLAKLGRLYCARGKLLVAIYPPETFKLFKEVYVLTYPFADSMVECYFKLFGLDYEMASVIKHGDRYEITDYSPDADIAFREKFSELSHPCDKKSLYKRRTLSKTWYIDAKPADLDQLKMICEIILTV